MTRELTDRAFLESLPKRDYRGLTDLEETALQEAVKYPGEFPAMFRMRPFLRKAIESGLITAKGYTLTIPSPRTQPSAAD
jgi:hypothetical protein